MRLAPVILAVLSAGAVAALAAAGPAGSAPGVLRGSIVVNKQWTCDQPVALDSVTVTIDRNSPETQLRGTSNDDAIHLRDGCTGRIGRVAIVQYHGDGIKIGRGVHDLVIGGGSIRCYGRDAGKHQDGIQAMGGARVTFYNLDVRCSSANNAAFFVNKGTKNPDLPTDIVCDGCFFSGGGITVRIYNSIRSGIRNSQVVTGRIRPLGIKKGSAIDPVDVGNTILPYGYDGPATPPAGTGAPGAAAAPAVSVLAPRAQVTRVRDVGGVTRVGAAVRVDRGATLRVRLVGPAGVPVPLLRQSAVGASVSGRLRTGIYGHAAEGARVPIALRVSTRRLRPGAVYRLLVSATAGGRTQTATVRYRR